MKRSEQQRRAMFARLGAQVHRYRDQGELFFVHRPKLVRAIFGAAEGSFPAPTKTLHSARSAYGTIRSSYTKAFHQAKRLGKTEAQAYRAGERAAVRTYHQFKFQRGRYRRDPTFKKFERCVRHVKTQHGEVNPYAVCRVSTKYKGPTR